ncbi:hypothetical protein [Mesobacillus zeae]|uniref:HNH endonuclease n=1 Tax=Mesobacillus zeae TaxID=1917180 RepID=A0A398BJ22_9BACI|nr:hypothetical protein [Mesobacillus zeae]RID89011.1 hypothetical protein D1970_00475 [Mesobacillus zeae]
MALADSLVSEIQDLLDAGHSKSKTADILGLNHKQVIRVMDKYSLEIYTPFDSDYLPEAKQEIDEFYAEDLLEKLCDIAFDDLRVNISECLEEEFESVGGYINQKYGSIFKYLDKNGKSALSECIYASCGNCGVEYNLTKYQRKNGRLYGLVLSECNKCRSERIKYYYQTNPDAFKRVQHTRRARPNSLPHDITLDELRISKEAFNNSCVLTGSTNTQLDHVIPIAIGHGGSTYGNMVPLRPDLNHSKNDSNIFEWFEANRQRFELPQERFDNLIDWLASAKAMTVEDYRDYVYWCHANPRNIDESEAI